MKYNQLIIYYRLAFCLIILFFLHLTQVARAQLKFDIETGIIATGYNDVRIPGSTGTLVSLSDELNSNPNIFSRVNVGYRFKQGHEILALYAPLNINYKGSVDRDVIFQGETYPANSSLNATYKFNSYRLTYRYHLIDNNCFDIGVGLSLKVRDALIGFRSGIMESEKTDLGIVPLINFSVHWKPTERIGMILNGDALAAPQGRAEDVLLAVTFKGTENLTLKAGYRILEGGADNATVYTFSLFHYGVLGVIIRLE
jgi:hypothetical protein